MNQTEPLNPMAAAFADAGFVPPEDALRQMMRQAILEGVGMEARCLAIFERRLTAVEPGRLHRSLVGIELLRSAVLRLFYEVRNEIRREQEPPPSRTQAGGQPLIAGTAGHSSSAAPTSPGTEATPVSPDSSGHTKSASAPAKPPYTPSSAFRQVAEAVLDTILIDGEPIGRCSAGRVRTWARRRGREARFADLLTRNLLDDTIISEAWSAEDAAQAWRLAELEI